MSEYIKKSSIIGLAHKMQFGRILTEREVEVVEMVVNDVPAADVVEARHGVPNPIEEIYEDTDGAHVYRHIVGYECPFCGSDRIAKYCADCGAKMDGGADGERKGGDE